MANAYGELIASDVDLRGELPAPGAERAPAPRRSRTRALTASKWGALARAREPGRQRQRPLDPSRCAGPAARRGLPRRLRSAPRSRSLTANGKALVARLDGHAGQAEDRPCLFHRDRQERRQLRSWGGISVGLTEGNNRTLRPISSSCCCPNEVVTEVLLRPSGNPGEAKVTVTVLSRCRGESNKFEQPRHLPRRLPVVEGTLAVSELRPRDGRERLAAARADRARDRHRGSRPPLALYVVIWMRRVRRAQRALLSGASGRRPRRVRRRHAGPSGDRRAPARRSSAALVEPARGAMSGAALQRIRPAALRRLPGGGRAAVHRRSHCSTASGHGLVVSTIQDAGSARVYVKRVRAGAADDVALAPEELVAVAAARAKP